MFMQLQRQRVTYFFSHNNQVEHPLLRLLIYIYVYMYTCSFIVHILPPFVDLYIIHYVFIAYSTLNIVSFVYIYIFINLFVFSFLNLFIYLFIFWGP